jgi:ribonuclease HI
VYRQPRARRSGEIAERAVALGQATNNVGELTAIGVALDLCDEAGVDKDVAVHVLTDSQYSNGVLVLGWKAKANQALIADVKARIRRRNVTVHWIAGHTGVAGNERADALARDGVDGSKRGRTGPV